jgi:hypothetical protein
MSTSPVTLLIAGLAASGATAAEWVALPEYLRTDPSGRIIEADNRGPVSEWTRVSLKAARGGYVSFQLVAKTANPYTVSVNLPLRVDVFREWYHHIDSIRKQYPDALIPVSAPYRGKSDHQAQAFWVDVWVPADSTPGKVSGEAVLEAEGRKTAIPIEIEILRARVPADDAVAIDHNSYGSSWLPGLYPHARDTASILKLIHAYHRIFREHRGVYHQLGYGHGGKVGPEFAPVIEGSGRNKRISDWDLFDRHYGPLLDGSAFRESRRGPHPIPYVYLPINPEWPASFLWWGEPGYEAEFVNVVSAMEQHFRQKGWTQTRFELFFNHKKRYKAFPWDGDEVRFPKDMEYSREFQQLFRKAVPSDSPVKFVHRADVSWMMERQFKELAGVVNFWVAGGGMLSWYRSAVSAVKSRGDIVWHYGGTPEIQKVSSSITTNVLKTWMWDIDGYVHWLAVSPGSDPWFHSDGGSLALVYPGEKFGIREPIPSIRLKIQRNCAQDIALLNSLPAAREQKKMEAAKRFNGTRPDQWWNLRPALANTTPEDWSNADIEEAESPNRKMFEDIDAAAWQRVRDHIMAAAAEVKQ